MSCERARRESCPRNRSCNPSKNTFGNKRAAANDFFASKNKVEAGKKVLKGAVACGKRIINTSPALKNPIFHQSVMEMTKSNV
jgi:hypothetical protein